MYIDTHIDLLFDMKKSFRKFSPQSETGHVDLLRARKGAFLAGFLAIFPTDERINPVTGRPTRRETPKKLASVASVSVAIEDFVTFMLPSLPIYSLLGGTVTPWRRFIQGVIRGAFATGTSVVTGREPKQEKKRLQRQFRRIKPGETRF